MDERSPAQVFAIVIGTTLLVVGIVGFFYNASFGTGDGTDRDAVFGLLDVNGWHNLVHIASGAIGLLLYGTYDGARAYALLFGAIYLIVAAAGFAAGDGEELFRGHAVLRHDPHGLIGAEHGRAGVASNRVGTPQVIEVRVADDDPVGTVDVCGRETHRRRRWDAVHVRVEEHHEVAECEAERRASQPVERRRGHRQETTPLTHP
jgi:hypothetical protein